MKDITGYEPRKDDVGLTFDAFTRALMPKVRAVSGKGTMLSCGEETAKILGLSKSQMDEMRKNGYITVGG